MTSLKRLIAGTAILGLCLLASQATTPRAFDGKASTPGQLSNDVDSATQDVSLFQKTKKRKKARGRLPNNYGKVGVDKKQREMIYDIQATYREKMEALEQQLAEMKTKRDAEIEAVLTVEQKTKLKELIAAAKKKRDDRTKKRKPKKAKT